MELDEMKSKWMEMSAEVEQQKKLTSSLIIRMTAVSYRNKLNKILVPEAIGALGGWAASLAILVNLQKLDTPYLMACGIISVVILFILPVLSIGAVYKMGSISIISGTYSQALAAYAKGKLRFVLGQ
jgi:hypothetical protein